MTDCTPPRSARTHAHTPRQTTSATVPPPVPCSLSRRLRNKTVMARTQRLSVEEENQPDEQRFGGGRPPRGRVGPHSGRRKGRRQQRILHHTNPPPPPHSGCCPLSALGDGSAGFASPFPLLYMRHSTAALWPYTQRPIQITASPPPDPTERQQPRALPGPPPSPQPSSPPHPRPSPQQPSSPPSTALLPPLHSARPPPYQCCWRCPRRPWRRGSGGPSPAPARCSPRPSPAPRTRTEGQAGQQPPLWT